jgi:alpha-tubulin suppressor-like RCC1 family protein
MTSSCCQADAGGEHTLARTNSGAILSAGACGLGWCRSLAMVPTLFGWRTVNIPEPITTLHAAYYHNLAIGHSGKLYSWGCGTFVDGNNDGVIPALGQDREDRGESPSLVHDVHAIAISGGAYHSIVLDNQQLQQMTVPVFPSIQCPDLSREMTITHTNTSNVLVLVFTTRWPCVGRVRCIAPEKTRTNNVVLWEEPIIYSRCHG